MDDQPQPPDDAARKCAEEIRSITPFERSFSNHDGFERRVLAIVARNYGPTMAEVERLRGELEETDEALGDEEASSMESQDLIDRLRTELTAQVATIERLTTERDELLAACKSVCEQLDELEGKASMSQDMARTGEECNYQNGKQTAYEKANELLRSALSRVESGRGGGDAD